jgi:membrane-associated phospholipid phosphatase
MPGIALIVKLVRPRANVLIPARAIVFTLSVVVIAPGLLTNVLLKEHWHRPRPISVDVFGGDREFVPWWSTAGDCQHNCSFVSGDVSMAAWTVAVAAVAPPAWRALAYGGAFAFTTLIGLIRLAFGAHFFTDVTFAFVLTFLVAWLLHGVIYRWPGTRSTDDDIERTWERLGRGFRHVLSTVMPGQARP